MIAYIKGSLEIKLNDSVVVETAGVGYKIFMPQNEIEKLRKHWRYCKNTYISLCKRRQYKFIWLFYKRKTTNV